MINPWEEKLSDVLNKRPVWAEVMRPCPKITYKKWWHRFIPSYRKKIKMLNIMMEHDWQNGLREEVDKQVREYILYGKQ